MTKEEVRNTDKKFELVQVVIISIACLLAIATYMV